MVSIYDFNLLHNQFFFQISLPFSFERYKNDVGDTCYASVGYTTVYRFYSYPDKLRPRISQVLVLPPFRNNGLASKMIEVYLTEIMIQEVFSLNYILWILDNL